MQWVVERVKVPDFQKAATRFTKDMTRRLKLAKKITSERTADPDAETALKYTRGISPLPAIQKVTTTEPDSIL